MGGRANVCKDGVHGSGEERLGGRGQAEQVIGKDLVPGCLCLSTHQDQCRPHPWSWGAHLDCYNNDI